MLLFVLLMNLSLVVGETQIGPTTIFSAREVRTVAPAVNLSLKEVFTAYGCGYDEGAAPWLVARMLQVDQEKVRVIVFDNVVFFWTDTICHGELTSTGQAVKMFTITAGGMETTSFPLVTLQTGGLQNGPTRMLRPPVCACPKAGGQCTQTNCENITTCTGTDGTTSSCGFQSNLV